MANANANQEIRAMLDICGISNTPQVLIPNQQAVIPAVLFVDTSGIVNPVDLLKYTTDSVDEIVKSHNRRWNGVYVFGVFVNGVVHMNLKALVYFARYNWRRNKPFGINEWDQAVMATMIELMTKAKASKTDNKIGEAIDPGPIDIEGGYRNWVGRFKNKLRSMIGAADVPLIYVIRADGVTPDPNNPIEVDAYEMRLDGPEYDIDKKAVYTLLYKACNHDAAKNRREALTWIEPFVEQQDGRRAAYVSFCTHFEGEGASNTRKAEAFAQIDSLHWRSETAMPFTTFSSHLKDAYDIVTKDAAFADEYKVRDLLSKIKPTSKVMEVEVAKGHIRNNIHDDFEKAITYLTGAISTIFADEIARINRYGGVRRSPRNIYAVERGGRGRGGRGQAQGRGNRGGRGGRGKLGYPRHTVYDFKASQWATRPGYPWAHHNGVDCTDATRAFSVQEWEQMGREGRQYVATERSRKQQEQANRGRGGRTAGRGGRGQNATFVRHIVDPPRIYEVEVALVEQDQSQHTGAPQDGSTIASRGGRNGSAFGRGAHHAGGRT